MDWLFLCRTLVGEGGPEKNFKNQQSTSHVKMRVFLNNVQGMNDSTKFYNVLKEVRRYDIILYEAVQVQNVAWLNCSLRGQERNTLNNLDMWIVNSCWMWSLLSERFVFKRKTYWEVVYMWGHFVGVISFILMFSEVTSAIIFEKRNLGNNLGDARNNFTDMRCIWFSFWFYGWLLLQNDSSVFIFLFPQMFWMCMMVGKYT